jgi:hypothetical protein
MYIHMYSIVRNNLLLRLLSYLVVRSLRMATSRNMYEPDKVKYILVQYVHLLVLRDCNHSQSTERIILKWQKRRSSSSIHICIHKTNKLLLKKIWYSFWSTSVQYNFYQTLRLKPQKALSLFLLMSALKKKEKPSKYYRIQE